MDEEMILPDDFQEETAIPQAEDNIETTDALEVEDTKPTEETQEQTEIPQEQPKIRIKYNHEEKELTLEEATLLAQKGMNYDKAVERLKAIETDPRLSFVEMQARKYNMSPDEYIEAVQKQEEQDQLNQLIQANIPEEYAKEMLESRKFREQQKAQIKEQQEKEANQAKQNIELDDFIKNYPDVKAEDIPKDVYEYRNNTGKSLTEAMMWHENKELKNQIKILKQNEENRKKAPVGGVTLHGSTETAQDDPFLSGFNSI